MLSAGLAGQDLLDALGDIPATAGSGASEAEATRRFDTEIRLERLARDLRDRRATAFRLLETDGLLHVSNVGPGRVAHIQDVMDRGDVVDVLVQEVDKDRGRIGLKLVAKHENGGLVTPEELIERAKSAPPREEREERPRGDRGRGGGRDRVRSRERA